MSGIDETALRQLLRTPECRAELARLQAKTSIHQDALVAEAIRDAVKQDRDEADALLAQRIDDCLFCSGSESPCAECRETARLRGTLAARPLL